MFKQAIPNGIELPPMFPRLLRPYLPATEVGGKINKISIFPFLGTKPLSIKSLVGGIFFKSIFLNCYLNS